eukprot:6188181-Pleurochrysis_carterae.AAC.2
MPVPSRLADFRAGTAARAAFAAHVADGGAHAQVVFQHEAAQPEAAQAAALAQANTRRESRGPRGEPHTHVDRAWMTATMQMLRDVAPRADPLCVLAALLEDARTLDLQSVALVQGDRPEKVLAHCSV